MSFDAAEQRGFNRRTKRIDSDTRGASMSTKVTHTPAPWAIEVNPYVKGELVVGGRTNVRICGLNQTDPTHEANAHLIAAAPDMLEALEATVRAIDLDYKLSDAERESAEMDAVRLARSAIKKARGIA